MIFPTKSIKMFPGSCDVLCTVMVKKCISVPVPPPLPPPALPCGRKKMSDFSAVLYSVTSLVTMDDKNHLLESQGRENRKVRKKKSRMCDIFLSNLFSKIVRTLKDLDEKHSSMSKRQSRVLAAASFHLNPHQSPCIGPDNRFYSNPKQPIVRFGSGLCYFFFIEGRIRVELTRLFKRKSRIFFNSKNLYILVLMSVR